MNLLLNYFGTDVETYSTEFPIISKRLSDLFIAIYEAQPYEVRERIIEAIPKDLIKKTHYFPYLYLFTFCHYVNAGKTAEACSYYEILTKLLQTTMKKCKPYSICFQRYIIMIPIVLIYN